MNISDKGALWGAVIAAVIAAGTNIGFFVCEKLSSMSPVITRLDPSEGKVNSTVIIMGKRFRVFHEEGKVRIGTKETIVKNWSDREIEVEIPMVEPEQYDIVIHRRDGKFSKPSNFKVLATEE